MTTVLDIAVPEEVLAEIDRKSAAVEFQHFRDVVTNHFPDAVSVKVQLTADPDEDDRNWIVFEVTLTQPPTPEEYCAEVKAFYHELGESRPHVAWPICVLNLEWVRE